MAEDNASPVPVNVLGEIDMNMQDKNMLETNMHVTKVVDETMKVVQDTNVVVVETMKVVEKTVVIQETIPVVEKDDSMMNVVEETPVVQEIPVVQETPVMVQPAVVQPVIEEARVVPEASVVPATQLAPETQKASTNNVVQTTTGHATVIEDSESSEEEELTMQDVVDSETALIEEANAVLGEADPDACSYDFGYMRQAIYVCLTCTPTITEPAAICLACSLQCHEGHEVNELYTKRHFKCDCGNSKFAGTEGRKCCLIPAKKDLNTENVYNQNFQGLYCTCSRPYPDPRRKTPQVRKS